MAVESCPNCGADVPPRARACPECGSDERTGWSEEAASSHLDLPDESFDYNDFVKREFGRADPRPRGVPWLWWTTAIVLIVSGFVWWFFR